MEGRGILADTAAGVAGQSEAGVRVVVRSAILRVAHRNLRVEEREAVVRVCLQFGEFILIESREFLKDQLKNSQFSTVQKNLTFFYVLFEKNFVFILYLEAVAGAGEVVAGSLEASALAVVCAGLELEAGVTVAGAHERAHAGSSIAVRFREAGHVQRAGRVVSGEGLQKKKSNSFSTTNLVPFVFHDSLYFIFPSANAT